MIDYVNDTVIINAGTYESIQGLSKEQQYIYTMALAVGFEPTNPFELPVFKTGGLNRTLPSKHIKLSLQNYEWLRRTSRQCF